MTSSRTTILAARLTFKSEELPLRSALAQCSRCISDYGSATSSVSLLRAEVGRVQRAATRVARAYEELEADLTEEPDAGGA